MFLAFYCEYNDIYCKAGAFLKHYMLQNLTRNRNISLKIELKNQNKIYINCSATRRQEALCTGKIINLLNAFIVLVIK